MAVPADDTRDTAGQAAPWERLALASGIAFSAVQFAALVFAAVALFPSKPPFGAPVAEQAAHYAQYGTTYAIVNYLLALPAPFFLLFLGGLFGVLRRAEGGSGALAVGATGAGVAMAMLWPLGCMLTNLGTTIAQNGGDAATVWALDGLAPLSLALSALPRATLLGASSVVLLNSGLAPRWIGWSGLALGLVGLITSGVLVVPALFPLLMLGTILFKVYIVALSVALLRGTRAVGRTAPQVVPA
jgi:hypothetical protein